MANIEITFNHKLKYAKHSMKNVCVRTLSAKRNLATAYKRIFNEFIKS